MKTTLNVTEKLGLMMKPARIDKRNLSDSQVKRANRFYKQAGDITGIYFEVSNSGTDE
tara:strand:+ start:665 stop:838 length:174 start_codon:yes stop_codon:yes gene_type:complete